MVLLKKHKQYINLLVFCLERYLNSDEVVRLAPIAVVMLHEALAFVA